MWNLNEFILAALLVLLVPGPTNTLLITHAATAGARSAAKLISAEVLGYVLTITLLSAIVAPTIKENTWLGPTLRVICSIYLAIMAFHLWRSAQSIGSQSITWLKVFITTATNPKAMIFTFIMIPADQQGVFVFLTTHGLTLVGLITIAGSIWVSAGSIIHAGIGTKGGSALRRGAASIIAGFSIYIMLSAVA